MPSKIRVAFLIDGKCEKALVTKLDQQHHDFSFIKRDKNGRDVTLEAIAKECIALLKGASRLHRVLIVIVDKEERPNQTALQFENQLVELIKNEFTGSFELVSTDIMFENWILSDIEMVSQKNSSDLSLTPNSTSHESINGSGKLDSIWIRGQGRGTYSSDKVTNSKKLFKCIQPTVGRNFSASFARFLDILTKHNIKMH